MPDIQTEDTAKYCHDLVHEADRDRYLSTLFAPDEKRPHLLALYAFNLEIARIRELVHDPMPGEVRLQWWRDTIEAIYEGSVADHPVAQQLAGAIDAGNLTKLGFDSLLEARAFDLYDDPMPSLDALEGYLGETSSSIIQMAALVLTNGQAKTAADAAGHAGIAYGLTGLMRIIPIHRARGQCFLPAELLARHDISPAHVLAGRQSEAIRISLLELRQVAKHHLAIARERAHAVPPAALPAFLPVKLIDMYLKRMERIHNPLHKVLEVGQMRRQWSMLMAAIFREF